MKELYPLFGIVTVLNTPFREDGSVDYGALRLHSEYALKAGVAGFLVPAMASEMTKLTVEERLGMVQTVMEAAGDRVPVIAGAGDPDPEKARIILKEYLSLGCRNVLLQIPFRNAEHFRGQFLELAGTGPEMIMLQDWDATGYGLPDELIGELFETVEAFRCLKVETIPAGVKYTRILELTDGRLNVSGGWAVTQMTEGLKRGVHAFMPTGMHAIYCNIYSMFRNGEIAGAEQLFRRILPVLNFSNQHLDISIHFFKWLLYRQGIYPTPNLRDPFLPFDALHQEIAAQHIATVIALENEFLSKPNL
jgi:dihydrodipicolinate synthase/N-acetylneuraminate lyase